MTMLSSATQPVKDPQAFAKSYADVVNNIINQHRQQRVPESFQQIAEGAERMDVTAPARQKDYTG